MERYLVTGGAGFIGSHMCEKLLRDGHSVRILDNFSSGKEANLAAVQANVEILDGDVREEEMVSRAVKDVDIIVHHAAIASVARSVENPILEHEVNLGGTLRLMDAARKGSVRRFVLASTAAAYGDDPTPAKKESLRPRPQSPYAISKVSSEQYCRVYSDLFNLETIVLRYFNVFGPRQDASSDYSGVISIFVDRMLEGRRPKIFGDGEQSRDFVFVDDVVNATLSACEAPRASGEIFNVGCGCGISVGQLVRELNSLLDSAIEPEFATQRPGDLRSSLADISNAEKHLGYTPTVSFAQGLRRTVDWVRTQGS